MENSENAACALADDFDLLLRLELKEDDEKARRIAGAFTMALVGGIAGQRFNGAYFFVCDADGNELPDQPLESSPLYVGIRSMGVEDPSDELLDKVAASLEAMLQRVTAKAGLEATVAVTRPPR